MRNWYKILGVAEDVTPDELERLEDVARREHHPDHHQQESQEGQDWHEAHLMMWLEGISFLLSKGRKLLDAHLWRERAAEQAEQAAAEAEAIRKRNEEEARQRDDADDLRKQFGSPPQPSGRTRSAGGSPPPTPPRPPVSRPEHGQGRTNPVFSVIELIYDLGQGIATALLIGISVAFGALATGVLSLAAGILTLIAGAFLCVGALWVCVELLTLLITGHFAPG